MTVSWLLVARDGGILALGAGALIAVPLRFNPRLFLRHFPEELQRAMPPKNAATIPFEHARHFRAFLRGSITFAVIGAALALVVRV